MFLAVVVTAACDSGADARPDGGASTDTSEAPLVRVRLRNDGNADFLLVVVSDADTRTCSLGPLAVGETSGWCPSADFYRYFPVIAVADCQVYEVGPSDYVGETPLAPGDYTVPITFSVEEGGLALGVPEREPEGWQE